MLFVIQNQMHRAYFHKTKVFSHLDMILLSTKKIEIPKQTKEQVFLSEKIDVGHFFAFFMIKSKKKKMTTHSS